MNAIEVEGLTKHFAVRQGMLMKPLGGTNQSDMMKGFIAEK